MELDCLKMTTSEGVCSKSYPPSSELSSFEFQSNQMQAAKNESRICKDNNRRKKANRSAKLKQCKLDARREQWLSQGKNKGLGQRNADSGNPGPSKEGNKVGLEHGESHVFSDLDSRSSKSSIGEEDNEGSSLHDSDCESTVNNPCGAIGKENSRQWQHRPGSSSSGSSMCISEEDDGSLDDWEAVADALNINVDHSSKPSPEKTREETTSFAQFHTKTCFSMEAEMQEILKPEYKINPRAFPHKAVRTGDGRAWRPDDTSRPVTLPSLSKQHSFPAQSGSPGAWGSIKWNSPPIPHALPTSCPICYEDLDVTDSNFMPCVCGFRLCLFCYKRIIEEDGRCPGCRKHYAPLDAGTKASACPRLPRSCSMRLRA